MALLQIAAAQNLQDKVKKTVEGRAKLGIEAFAQALLGIPKILAENSGYDAQETVIKLQVWVMVCGAWFAVHGQQGCCVCTLYNFLESRTKLSVKAFCTCTAGQPHWAENLSYGAQQPSIRGCQAGMCNPQPAWLAVAQRQGHSGFSDEVDDVELQLRILVGWRAYIQWAFECVTD